MAEEVVITQDQFGRDVTIPIDENGNIILYRATDDPNRIIDSDFRPLAKDKGSVGLGQQSYFSPNPMYSHKYESSGRKNYKFVTDIKPNQILATDFPVNNYPELVKVLKIPEEYTNQNWRQLVNNNKAMIAMGYEAGGKRFFNDNIQTFKDNGIKAFGSISTGTGGQPYIEYEIIPLVKEGDTLGIKPIATLQTKEGFDAGKSPEAFIETSLDTPTNVVDDNYIKGSSNGPSRTDKILIETLEDFASYSKIPFSDSIEISKQNQQGVRMSKELGYTEDGFLYLYNSIDSTYQYVDPNDIKKLELFLQENDLIDFLYTNQLYVPFQIDVDKEILTKEKILKLPDIPVNHITEGVSIIRNLKEKYPDELIDLVVDFDNVDGGRINIQSLFIDSDIKEKEIYLDVANELNQLSNKYNVSINVYDDNPIHNFYNIIDQPTGGSLGAAKLNDSLVFDSWVDNYAKTTTSFVDNLPLSTTVKNQFNNLVQGRARNLATPGGLADAVDVWELGVLGLMISAVAYKEYDEIPTILTNKAVDMFNNMTSFYGIPPIPKEEYDLDYERINKIVETGEKFMPTDIIIKKVGDVAKGAAETGAVTGFGYVPPNLTKTDTMETTQKIQPGVQEEKMFEEAKPKKIKSTGGSRAKIL